MKHEDTAPFGVLLKRYRAAAGLTQEDLAERAALSVRGISDLERGVNRGPRPDTIRRLVDALHLEPDEQAALAATAHTILDDQTSGPFLSPLPTGNFLGALPAGAILARVQELARLQVAIDAVAAGNGRLVLLAGEPGVGKTRLAQEVALDLRNARFLVGTGMCSESRQTVPYYPFLDALTILFDKAPPGVRAQIPQRWPHVSLLLHGTGLPTPVAGPDGQVEHG